MMDGTPEDQWNFYSCEISGRPHSTFVNLTLAASAPIKPLSCFHGIDVELQFPHPEHGMTTDKEFDRLSDMGDLIGTFETSTLRFVARQTGNGLRRFYFYAQSKDSLSKALETLTKTFSDYEFSHFEFDDPDWTTYFSDLYPNGIALNEMSNRDVCSQLLEHGDQLHIGREIDHNFYFTNNKAAKRFSAYASGSGYSVTQTAKGFFKKEIHLLLQKAHAPSELDPITFELAQESEALGGIYDGWGCSVMAKQS